MNKPVIMKINKQKFNKLSSDEERIIVNKGTEAPGSGEYDNFFVDGLYICRRCNTPLYKSDSKFDAHCGWPSFDQEIIGRVNRHTDLDGLRTEINCAVCGAHLGHVFTGEKMTAKNSRHCVNSLSIRFVPRVEATPGRDVAVFGGGCFWCSEAIFQRLKGIFSVLPGYAGGTIANPTYEQVSSGQTGHAEVIKIEYDPKVISYKDLLEVFFALHDPTTLNQQGNDIGTQYRSIILFNSDEEWRIANDYIDFLEKNKEFKNPIVTELKPLLAFYPAENYHKNYYLSHPNQLYCKLIISPKIIKLEKKFNPKLKPLTK